MNTYRDLDDILATWLDDGPTDLPPATRRAIVTATRATRQSRGGFALPARRSLMSRFIALAGAAAVVVVAVGLAAVALDRPTGTVGGPAIPTPSATPIATASPPSPSPSPERAVVSAGWSNYTSSQYPYSVGHPAAWTVTPANRAWTFEADTGAALTDTPGADHFTSDDLDVRVSAWFVPFDSGTTLDSVEANLAAWVEDYCRRTGNTPCTGIADRAVPMCLERRDCHAALLVPFKDDVQAFFAGGIYDSTAMTVVAVWRGESAPATARYGGSQRLLEAFLSTMQVYPNPNP
jgi:hypothetical protein